METAKHTHREISHFIAVATAWQHKAPIKDAPMTSFRYAIMRVLKAAKKVDEDREERLTEINIEGASSDKEGNILTDSTGQPIFNKEASKKRNIEIREILNKEVEVGVYFAKQYPDDLTDFQISAFAGFVIAEIQEPPQTE